MPPSIDAVPFFDIGDTLASVRLSPTERGIEAMCVFPDVPPALVALRDAKVRLGILSDRGPIAEGRGRPALDDARLLHFFDRELILFGRKDTPRILWPRRGCLHARTLAAAFLVAAHPSLAMTVLRQRSPLRRPASGKRRATRVSVRTKVVRP